MCGGAYAPPVFLLPLILVFSAAEGVKRLATSIDDSIHSHHEKLVEKGKETEKKKREERAFELDHESSSTITLLKKETGNDEELAALLLKRATIRLEDHRIEEALVDMKEAWRLLEHLQVSQIRDNYLTMYLKGSIEYACGDFVLAGDSFLKSIQLRESLVDSNNQPLSEDAVVELEKEFIELQMNSKNSIERTVSTVSQNVTRFSINFNNNVKNFFNHTLKLDTSKPVLKEKPRTIISLEYLYVRAAISFYNSSDYEKAISLLTSAISIGSVYDSDLLESSYFNRGLCNYYLSKEKVNTAIEDFTQSISLMPLTRQRDQTYWMRACAYGRLGLTKQKSDDERKAKFINPFSHQISAFHIRILDDDTLFNILSFLPARTLITSAASGKVWRNVIVKYLQNYQIQVSFDSLNHNVSKKVEESRRHTVTYRDFIHNAMENSLLKHVTKIWIPVTKNYDYGTYTNIGSFTSNCVKKFHNMKGIAVEELDMDIANTICGNNPGLNIFELRQAMPSFVEIEAVQILLKNLKELESVSFLVCLLTFDPFVNHSPSLKHVEYYEPNEEDLELFKCRNGSKSKSVVAWDELRRLHPEITFTCLKGNWKQKIHQEEPWLN